MRPETTAVHRVTVGDRVLVVQQELTEGGGLRRAGRSDAGLAEPATVTRVLRTNANGVRYAGGTHVAFLTDIGPVGPYSRRFSVLTLPPADGVEADERLHHGIELLRHGAALVAPEVLLLPVDADRTRALRHTLDSIEALVHEFEESYDLDRP